MKLAILSRAPRSYSTQRLRTAAQDRGHDVKVLNTLRFGIDLSGKEPDLAATMARIPEMLAKGVIVALGPDGGCANNRQSVFEEMRMSCLIAKARLTGKKPNLGENRKVTVKM